MTLRALLPALAALLATACAHRVGGTNVPADYFPKRAEVEQLKATAPKVPLAKLAATPVPGWTLAGPFFDDTAVRSHPNTGQWGALLETGATQVGAKPTWDMHCIAREAGRFLLEKDGYPGQALRAFIEGRCGTTAEDVRLHALVGEADERATDEALVKAQGEQVLAALTKLSPGKGSFAGLWAGRAGKRTVVMLAAARPAVTLKQPLQLVPKGATVVVRGRVERENVHRVSALINHGPTGVSDCKSVDVLELPDFAFECPVDAADESTWLEVAAFEPGRLLGHGAGMFLLWPKGAPSAQWNTTASREEIPEGQVAEQVLGGINALRKDAGLPLLVEEPAESETVRALAPRYVGAMTGDLPSDNADRVALSILAGWDVAGGEVVSSDFGNVFVSGSRDLNVILEALMRSPFQRRAATAPNATRAGVGVLEETGVSALAVLFGTYTLLPTFVRKDAEVAIITRLNQMRLDRGRSLAQWTLWPEDVGGRVADNLRSGGWTPGQAMRVVLDETAAVSKGQVTGYVQLVDDLDHFQFPIEVLARESVNVFLAVGVYRGADWPQTRYVVCFVLANSGDIEVASR